MRRIYFLIIILLFIIPLTSTFSQEESNSYCIAYYWNEFGLGMSEGLGITEILPSGIVNIDDGSGKHKKMQYDSCVKFIEDMKKKGWILIQTNSVSTGKREIPVLYMLFEKKTNK